MSHYHTLSYIIISLNRDDRANSAKQKHNSTDICFLVDTRANVIIVDATHLISRYARDFTSFLPPARSLLIAEKTPGIINSGSSLYFVQLSVILLVIEFRQTRRLSEDIHLSSPSTDYLRVAYHRACACACDVKRERLHG